MSTHSIAASISEEESGLESLSHYTIVSRRCQPLNTIEIESPKLQISSPGAPYQPELEMGNGIISPNWKADDEEDQKLKELLVCISRVCPIEMCRLMYRTGTAIAYIERRTNCPKRTTTVRCFDYAFKLHECRIGSAHRGHL